MGVLEVSILDAFGWTAAFEVKGGRGLLSVFSRTLAGGAVARAVQVDLLMFFNFEKHTGGEIFLVRLGRRPPSLQDASSLASEDRSAGRRHAV